MSLLMLRHLNRPFYPHLRKKLHFVFLTISGKNSSSEQSPAFHARTSCVYLPLQTPSPCLLSSGRRSPYFTEEVLSDRANRSKRSSSEQGRSRFMARQVWHFCLPYLISSLPLTLPLAAFLKPRWSTHYKATWEAHSYYTYRLKSCKPHEEKEASLEMAIKVFFILLI